MRALCQRSIVGKRRSGAMLHKCSSAILLAAFCLYSVLIHPPRARASRAGGGVTPDCERHCLDGFVDQYLAALVAHEPARLPWAKKVKFTENNVELQIGDG